MKIRIKKDGHTHEGRPAPVGTVLDASPHLAGWLVEQGIGEPWLPEPEPKRPAKPDNATQAANAEEGKK